MPHNPLVATPTVDKNGRITTVHKRADAGGTKASSSIPKVSLAAPPQDDAKKVVEAAFHTDVKSVKMSANVREKMMATLHPDTLPLMEKMLREHNDGIFVFRKATDWSADSRSFALLNSYMALADESGVSDRDNLLHILYSLRGVQQARPGRAQIDITDPDDPKAEGARALAKALIDNAESGLVRYQSLTAKGQAAYAFVDYEVGTLIIDRPDRADEIVDLYRSHGMFDRGLFEAALDSDAKALNAGVL
jgi:hypothetical protein